MKNNKFLFISLRTIVLSFLVSMLLLAKTSEAQLMNIEKTIAVPLEDFQVNENAGSCDKVSPAITLGNNGKYIITWQDTRNSDIYNIFAQRFDQNGQTIGDNILVAGGDTNQLDPDIAIDGHGNFVITWYHDWYGQKNRWNILAQRFDSLGNPIGNIFGVNDDWGPVHKYPAIAMNDEGSFVITWQDERQGAHIYAQRYKFNGDTLRVLGANFKVDDDTTNSIKYIPDIAVNKNGNFIIAWNDKRNGVYDTYAQKFDAAGKAIGINFKVNDSIASYRADSLSVSVGCYNNSFVIAWTDVRNGNYDIYAQIYDTTNFYDTTGFAIENNFKVNNDNGGSYQYNPVIASYGNFSFMIMWEDWRNGDCDIYAQCYSFTGDPLGGNFKINDDSGNLIQQNPTAAANAQGEFIVAWNDERNRIWDIYTQRFDSTGQKVGENLKATQEDGSSWQVTPAITADEAGNVVITWQDFRYDCNGDIYAQRYDINGQANGNNFKINDDAEFSAQENPALIMDRQGNFIIVWQDKRNGNDDIYGQRFDNSGKPQDSNFRINDDLGNSGQYDPAIGTDGNGRFVVVWEDVRYGGNYDIFCQRYSSSGTKLHYNFKVNDDVQNSGQYEPAISVDSKGNFVIVWQDRRNGNLDIFGQIFDSDGTPQGTNFQINNDEGANDQQLPDISMDSDGNFIVVWQHVVWQHQDNKNYYYIYGQCFTSNGEKIGANFRINNYWDNRYFLFNPSVSRAGNGYFVVTWDQNDSGNIDIYYQLFDNECNKIGMNCPVTYDPSGHDQEKPDVVMVNRYIYYTWRDNRIAGQGYDIFARIDVFNKAPESPTLLSPANHSFSTNNIPTFTFTIPDDNEGDSLQFKVEVAQDSNFINQIANSPFESQTDTAGFNPKPPLAPASGNCNYTVQSVLADGTYYWRVSTADGLGYGEPSATFNFKVDTTPPYTAEHNPTNGETNVAINTNIIVHVKDDISGVDSVTIKIKVNEQQVIPTITGSDTDYTVTYDPPNDFNYNDTITVSIEAQDKAGNVMATDNYSFTTKGKPNTAPEAPTLISPANNSHTNNTTPTLTWSIPMDVDGDSLNFKLELDDDNDWGNILHIIESKDNLKGFAPTPPVGQDSGNISYELQFELNESDWWWRVSAWDGKLFSPLSEVWKFTITKPHIEVTPQSLDFGDVDIGNSDSLKLTINNVGTDTLIIYDIIWTEKLCFSLTNTTGIISEGSGLDITVIFKPADEVVYTDTLKIYSNDPDEPVVKVAMVGSGKTQEIISVKPNPFTPNGDGFNDYVEFKYPGMDNQKPIIQIFNLKGRKVNELKDFSGSGYNWNGKDNSGRDLQPGVYIYILEVKGKRISNGTITLIR